jgi:transposase
MDTSQQVAVIPRNKEVSVAPLRQRRSIAEKRRIVEETLAVGASVARVARAQGINANQVFGWRRLYLAGRLGEPKPGVKLLPVRVSESKPAAVAIEPSCPEAAELQRGTIDVEFRQARVRIEGRADPALVRVLLECLRG